MTTHVVYIVTVAECFRHYEHAAVIVSMQLSLRTCHCHCEHARHGAHQQQEVVNIFGIIL